MNKEATSVKALTFVLIAVMINAIGFGIILPVLPNLVRSLTDVPNNEIVLHLGLMTFLFALMQFIFMPIFGALSDRFGRRPVMLTSLFGLGIDYFILAMAPTVWVLYIGRMISGALGATFSTANAYIADVSPPEKRAQNFALVGAAFGVGFILGPPIGGILGDPEKFLGDLASPQLPFYFAGCLSMINVAFGYFVLPETLPPEKRRKFEWNRATPAGAIRSLRSIKGAKTIMFIYFLLALAHTVYPTTFTISMETKLYWTPGDVALALGAFGVASFIVQAFVIRLVLPKSGLFYAGVIGILSTIIAYFGMGIAGAGWFVFAMGPFAALAGFYNPALTNMMSSKTSASEQGELTGAMGAAQGLAMMIGPLLMMLAFYIFAKGSDVYKFADHAPLPFLRRVFKQIAADINPYYEPGAPLILAAVLSFFALLLFYKVTNAEDRTRVLPTAETIAESAKETSPGVISE